MSHHGEIGDITAPRSKFYQGPYGRMFRNLPPYVPTIDLLNEISIDEGGGFKITDGKKGVLRNVFPGIEFNSDKKLVRLVIKNDSDYKEFRDALRIARQDDTEAGQEIILRLLGEAIIETDQNNEDPAGDNPCIPAGYTYFSQYITHDITFDPTSSLMRLNDPNRLRNFRTPRLDLDSLYGTGPDDMPFLYERDDPNDTNRKYYLLVGHEKSDEEDDLPRNSQGRALIGDMRNDENVILSQLHLAFIKLHNKVLDDVCKKLTGKRAFQEAQKLTQWHYQWVVLHDFLPKLVDEDIFFEILCGGECLNKPKLCYYEWRQHPYIPVEFSVAAFRFGHSMIRNRYALNCKDGLQFVPIIPHTRNQESLFGFDHLKEHWTIQWDKFLEIPGSPEIPKKSRKIDTKLSYRLSKLPSFLSGSNTANLAIRDLIRGYQMSLPSGQMVARALKEEPLPEPEVPLWYYILKEAETTRKGRRLGRVGGRIVAEVIIGLLAGDPHSFINVDPGWYPTYPSLGDKFELRDILANANMPLTKNCLPENIECPEN